MYNTFFKGVLQLLIIIIIHFQFPKELLSDNITKSAQCAQIVQQTDGFKAWRGWTMKCKSNINNLPPLKDCFTSNVIAG